MGKCNQFVPSLKNGWPSTNQRPVYGKYYDLDHWAGDEPPFLSVGTDVSAKYRGAFCEAKVKKIVRTVKCKVFLKESQTSVIVTDDCIEGPLKVGAPVLVNMSETNHSAEGVVNKVNDCSMYTVVFDDGDERTLRRTQLCLKGEKHFVESETLDHLPLSHPEHFGTPVMQSKKGKRGRYSASGADYEEDSSSEDSPPKRASYKGRFQELVGKVMCMETGDKRKSPLYVPVLVVLPDAHQVELKNKDHLLVRSFKDGKFITISKKDLKDFTREIALKNEDKGLKAAMEKALLYFDCHELPQNWTKEELLGTDDDSENDDEDSSDDEPCEEEDRFVAQLYKFMDDRGTPINKGPSLGNRDLNLYKLFKIVQNFGGYNKVTNTMKWRWVYSKMKMPASNNGSHQIKNAYKKYLHAFEDFYRKLGSTMGTISRPRSSRHSTGRSILFLRARDSCRSPRDRKNAVKEEEKNKDDDDKKTKDSDNAKSSSDTQSATNVEESENEVCVKKEPKEKSEEEPVKKETSKKDKVKREKERVKKEVKEEQDDGDAKEDKKSDKKEDSKHTRKRDDDKKADSSSKGAERKTTKKDKEAKTPDVKKELPKKRVRKRSTRGDDVKKETDVKNTPESMKSKFDMFIKDEKGSKETKSAKEEKSTKEKKNKEDKNKESREDKKEAKVKAEVDEEGDSKRNEEPADSEDDDDDEEDEEEEEEGKTVGLGGSGEYPTGTKLRVKYGRGRNQKIYEAKVVEFGAEGGHEQYLVHYAGWNTRYDEWVRPERIVKVLGKPELGTKKKAKSHSPRSPKGPGATKKRVQNQNRSQQATSCGKEENRPVKGRTPTISTSTTSSTSSSPATTALSSALSVTVLPSSATTLSSSSSSSLLSTSSSSLSSSSSSSSPLLTSCTTAATVAITTTTTTTTTITATAAAAATTTATTTTTSATTTTAPVPTKLLTAPPTQVSSVPVTPMPTTPAAVNSTPPLSGSSPRAIKDNQAKVRPTRSNSMEFPVLEGLPPKRRPRRSSGLAESSDVQSPG
uniref:ARID domain-containing protein n=1 Tax=Octopus bimaculoides TaxID=37653 RepID=A0A0L8GVL4_OCTBM